MRLTLNSHRTDPTTVALRPVGRVDAVTAVRLERWLAENMVFNLRVVLDPAGLSGCSADLSALLEETRRRAAREHVVLEVLVPAEHSAGARAPRLSAA